MFIKCCFVFGSYMIVDPFGINFMPGKTALRTMTRTSWVKALRRWRFAFTCILPLMFFEVSVT